MPEPTESPAICYVIGDARIDPRAHRITRAGVDVPVEPKAFAVLLELLRHPGEALERDHLLDVVWGHRHVTPAVLNRVIAMLRKALGDDADHPSVIRTVHGVGYALVAPMRTEAVSVEPAPIVPPALSGDASAPLATRANEAAIDPDAVAPARRVRRGRLVLAGVLAIVLAVLSLQLDRSGPEPVDRMKVAATAADTNDAATTENPATEPTLVVLPVVPASAAERDRELAASLGDALQETLVRVPGLRVTARESAHAAAASNDDAIAAGRKLGVAYVLQSGLVAAADDRVVAQLAVVRVADGARTWEQRHERPRAELLRVLGPVLEGLSSSLLPGKSQAATDPALAAPVSAQDLYWLSRRAAQEDRHDYARALELARRATAIDPDFALAWVQQSFAHRMLANIGQVGLDPAIAQAQAAIERALALDPNLAEAWQEQASIYTTQWRVIDAQPAIQRALELAPNDAIGLLQGATILSYAGRPRDALALHARARALDPLAPITRFSQLWTDLLLGRHDVIEQTYLATDGSGKLWARDYYARSLVMQGNVSAAALHLEAHDAGTLPLYPSLLLAQARSMLGRHDDAERTLAGIEPGGARPPLYVDVRLASFWARGRAADAVRWLEGEGANAVHEPWLSVVRAQARAIAGDETGALRDLDRVLGAQESRDLLAYSWYPTRIGVGHVANWLALRAQAGAGIDAELSALERTVEAMREGGVALPMLDYHRAQIALLRGDESTAQGLLEGAIARGWRDPVALDYDFTWRSVRESPWYRAQVEAMRAALARERATYDEAASATR